MEFEYGVTVWVVTEIYDLFVPFYYNYIKVCWQF